MTIAGVKKILAVVIILSVAALTSIYYEIVGIYNISDFFFNLVVVLPIVLMSAILIPLTIKTGKILSAAFIGASIAFTGGVLFIFGGILWELPNSMLAFNVGLGIWGFTLGIVIPATILGAIIGLIIYILKNKQKNKNEKNEKSL